VVRSSWRCPATGKAPSNRSSSASDNDDSPRSTRSSCVCPWVGYLLADEVGLGKTIEAGLIVRELILSVRAKTALLLVPASVQSQWQEELHEKLSLDVPRYGGSRGEQESPQCSWRANDVHGGPGSVRGDRVKHRWSGAAAPGE